LLPAEIVQDITRLPDAEWACCQEQPKKMRAWTYVAIHLQDAQRNVGVAMTWKQDWQPGIRSS
jgi:hypothetical protein